ncbi:MAG: hypothetical protein COB90_01245 [Hyphomicrobiales bacterium]|nr:MAG: hypothetical protein COB90_01245 [Hyphomicrobiales bacterium]
MVAGFGQNVVSIPGNAILFDQKLSRNLLWFPIVTNAFVIGKPEGSHIVPCKVRLICHTDCEKVGCRALMTIWSGDI